MITREQIHEIAEFEDRKARALSFYFQPAAPRNKAHKEEGILTKDLAREALRQIESRNQNSKEKIKEKCDSAHADLERIVRLVHDLQSTHGNGSHAKAVFACSAQNVWREYDLPAQLSSTQLFVGRHFHLKPLAQLLGAFPSLGVVLLDRHRARFFDLRLGELIERLDFFHPLPRRGRSDGFAGYDAGHAERRVADEARQHFKTVAESIKESLEKSVFEKWILGCQETVWPQFEPQMHAYAAQKLLGRFAADVAHITNDEIRQRAEQIFSDAQTRRCREAVRETLDQARSGARGVTGLRRVLRALEMGEVQTLLIGHDYHTQAVECSGCGHLDAHLVNFCPVCGRETREVTDVGEAILPWVVRRNIELFYVKEDPDFDQVGNIAALLRFRAEPNDRAWSAAAASAAPPSRATGLVGRYRGLAKG
jgi:peptide subunit release factor 1 (eRF1)